MRDGKGKTGSPFLHIIYKNICNFVYTFWNVYNYTFWSAHILCIYIFWNYEHSVFARKTNICDCRRHLRYQNVYSFFFVFIQNIFDMLQIYKFLYNHMYKKSQNIYKQIYNQMGPCIHISMRLLSGKTPQNPQN